MCANIVLADPLPKKIDPTGKLTERELEEKRKELERAAELAVERAVEKAAERAVERALNNGNSSTITVTTKESYQNAQRVAEEQAASGSESTRPYNPQIYNRQYDYQGGGDYKVDPDEAEELGISKEQVNSSVEGNQERPQTNQASGEQVSGEEVASAEEDGGVSYEENEGAEEAGEGGEEGEKDFQLGFSTDFGDLDISGISTLKGDFGMKNTKTFTNSYSKPKDEFAGGNLDIDPEEGATIFHMYASDFGGTGWSSAKQDGWVRHRPLWDDNNQNVGRRHFDPFGTKQPTDEQKGKAHKNEGEQRSEQTRHHPRRIRLHKRNVDNLDKYGIPLTAHSIDSATPTGNYEFLQKEIKLPVSSIVYGSVTPAPMKAYLTIPVPYVAGRAFRNNTELEAPSGFEPHKLSLPPKQLNDEVSQ